MRGIISIIIGAVFIIGGLSGKLVLTGTNSHAGIIVVGCIIAGIGVLRLARNA